MATTINKKLERQLTDIAKRHSYMVEERGNLQTRNNDSDDFLDISVWGLREMLLEAYQLGLKQSQQ